MMEMFKLFALELVNDKMGTRFCRLVSIVISRFDELHTYQKKKKDLMSYMVIVSDPFQLCHLTKALLIDSASHLTRRLRMDG